MSIRIILPAFRLARLLRILFHLTTPSLCLFPFAVKLLAFIGTVQTVSTAQLNFCQRVVNKHTIIDSHSASSSSELLEMLFVPTRIITLGILPGFINSPIQNNWAMVAPPKAITLVTQEVLKFESTLIKLSPSIRYDVASGGCCRVTAGFQVARLKQALGSASGTPLKLLTDCSSVHLLHVTLSSPASFVYSFLVPWSSPWWRCVANSLSGHHALGEPYSARIADRSIGCRHPGTWRILAGD